MAAHLALANQHVCDDNPAAALVAFERSIQEAPTAAAYAGRAALHMAVAAQPEESGSRSGLRADAGHERAPLRARQPRQSHARIPSPAKLPFLKINPKLRRGERARTD